MPKKNIKKVSKIEEVCPVCENRIEDCVCCPECGHVCDLNAGGLLCPVCGPVEPKVEAKER
ncbi:MAG: hypothetical protein HZB83_08920 [Deltaproteobacteria bacterium]|nr:hypothetical protein [Deltaproteobacteria bacterium]